MKQDEYMQICDFFDFINELPVFDHGVGIKVKDTNIILYIEKAFFDMYFDEMEECYNEFERNGVKMKYAYIIKDRINRELEKKEKK